MLQQPKPIIVRLQYTQSINLLIIIQEIKLSLGVFFHNRCGPFPVYCNVHDSDNFIFRFSLHFI
jgi:hypothetical protein